MISQNQVQLVISFFLFFAFANVFASVEKVKIAVDAGHGGTDQGAQANLISEAKLNLQIANLVKKNLSMANKIEIILTRTEDYHLPLSARLQKAQKNNAKVFISLHANSSPLQKVSGPEIYIPDNENTTQVNFLPELKLKPELQKIINDVENNKRMTKSFEVAKIFQTHWPELKFKQAPFYVLQNATIPSVLIELGYITNLQDSKKFKSQEFLNTLAQTLSKAILSLPEVKSLKDIPAKNINHMTNL